MGFANGVLRLRIAAKAIDGKANEALIKYVSEVLGVHPRNVFIAKGLASRDKVLAVAGISQIQLEAALISRTRDML